MQNDNNNVAAVVVISDLLNKYKEVTGKRYRMTKDAKSRGISRDVAFEEYLRSNPDILSLLTK
jgi:hypothetical protein